MKAKDQDRDYDLPWNEVILKAGQILEKSPNTQLFQKFTCAQCLTRQTITEPNKFYTLGQCEECGHTSDLRSQGFGYLAHIGMNNHNP